MLVDPNRLIMWRINDISKEGDRITFKDFDIVIKRTKGPKILLTKVISRQPHQEAVIKEVANT